METSLPTAKNTKVTNKEIKLYREMTDKIKLQKMYEQLGVVPTMPQKEQIDFVDNKKDLWFMTNAQGRRAGKSYGASVLIVRELLVPFASVKIVAPVMKITDIIWKAVVSRLRELNIKPVYISNNTKTLTLENGSVLFAAAETNKDSVLGTRSSLIVADEAAIFSDLGSFMELELSPTLMDYGVREDGTPYGRVVLISSPRGKSNYFYHQYLKGTLNVKGFCSIRAPSSVNPLITPEFLQSMKETCSPLVYAQEYEAEFVSVTGDTVFHAFNEKEHVVDFSKYTPFVRADNTIAGIDVGFSDSAAHLLVMCDAGRYFVYSESMFNKVNTKTMAERFKDKEAVWGLTPKQRYIDPSAALTAHDMVSLYDYFTFPARNDVKESLALINQLFEQGKLFISSECKALIQMIAEVEYNRNSNSKDPFKKHKEHHWDLLSALRYAIYTHYRVNTSQDIVVVGR